MVFSTMSIWNLIGLGLISYKVIEKIIDRYGPVESWFYTEEPIVTPPPEKKDRKSSSIFRGDFTQLLAPGLRVIIYRELEQYNPVISLGHDPMTSDTIIKIDIENHNPSALRVTREMVEAGSFRETLQLWIDSIKYKIDLAEYEEGPNVVLSNRRFTQ